VVAVAVAVAVAAAAAVVFERQSEEDLKWNKCNTENIDLMDLLAFIYPLRLEMNL
jgi:hypothetical protein